VDPLYADIVRLLAERAPFALGTVVHTRGSTPQRTGARALFLPGGELLGTLGGGCMEAEARRRGLLLTGGGEPDLLDLHLDDDFGWDDGLICGGTASILLQPAPLDQRDVFEAVLAQREGRRRAALVLVVSGPGGSPGRYRLFRPGESAVGDLGSPQLNAAVDELARAALLQGGEEPRRASLRETAAAVYLEPLLPRPVCLIAGAGHVGAALSHHAARVGFEVAIVDDRASLCSRERLPDADHVLMGDIVRTVREWPKTPDTYVVIVTRGHRHDAVVLREVVKAPVAYVGMIGSRRKTLTIFQELRREGLATPDELARVHAPIGLDIGAVSVEEIALCIAAELVMVRRRGAADGARKGGGDCAGGGGGPEDGEAEGALAVRLRNRAAGGRPLAESLPRRPDPGGAGTSPR